MIENPDLLFVYGTLCPPFTNSFAQFLRQRSQYVGEGTFPGLLFDLGSYPGATYQPDGVTTVCGTIYDISQHKQSVLACLDDYEGVSETIDLPNEYIRTVIPVRHCDDIIDCWVYLYNLPADGLPVIASGDYVRYSRNE